MARPSSADQARRLIALLGRLQPGTRIALSELAADLGVAQQLVASDLMTLSMCGIAPYDPLGLVPVMVEDGFVEVFGEIPALAAPVRLSASESAALAAALQTAGFDAEDELTGRLLAASARGFDPEELERQVRAIGGEHDPAVYETLANAIAGNTVVALEYADSDGALTERDVEPYALFAERGAWYLTAWCRRAGTWRTFRIDRIRTAGASAEVFSATRGAIPSARALDTSGLPVARLRFSADEPFIAREWPGGRVSEADSDADAGTTIVDVPYAGVNWIARHVAARFGAVEVLGPPEVRAAVRELAGQESARV